MGIETFNPQKHVKLEDGFVKKEASEKHEEAEILASIANSISEESISAQDLLESEASTVEMQRKWSKKLNIEAISGGTMKFEEIPEMLKRDKDVIKAVVSFDGWDLEKVSAEFKNDKEIVEAAIAKDGVALQFASEELRNDKDIVMNAMMTSPFFEPASDELKNDKEFIMEVYEKSPESDLLLSYLPENLKNDKDIVLALTAKYGGAFRNASEELKNDKDFVIQIVSRNEKSASAVYEISEELKNDKDVISAASKNHEGAIHAASRELQNDREFLLSLIEDNYHVMFQMGQGDIKDWKDDKEFVVDAVKKNPMAIMFASDKIKKEMVEEKK